MLAEEALVEMVVVVTWREMVATTMLMVTPAYMLREDIIPIGIDIASKAGFPTTFGARLLAARMVLFKMILILLHSSF